MLHYQTNFVQKRVMGQKYHKIIDKIIEFCKKVKVDDIRKVHIGITKDPKRRLFDEHKITDEDYWWIYTEAEDVDTARAVELHFLKMGMKGGPGGGDNETKFVYCFYKK